MNGEDMTDQEARDEREVVLAENVAGAFGTRSKLMHVRKGTESATFHGRKYRDTGRIAFKDKVRVFAPADHEGAR